MNENLSMSDQFMDIISRIIEDNIDNENFSVEDLAKGAGLTHLAAIDLQPSDFKKYHF